ncbi:MAG: penicillin-binding transpeptidase domain-containing protein [Vescimonas sp.]
MKSYLAKSRLVPLVLIFGMILLIFCGVLYNTQILNGSDYKARSLASNATAQTVEASRGIITDRNGKVLISNRLTYTLVFSDEEFESDTDCNDAIFRLLELCRSNNVKWTDTLPVSKEPPFTYTTPTDEGAFREYLESEDLPAITVGTLRPTQEAPLFMAQLRKLYGVADSYSDTDARAIIGVRYQLALRDIAGGTYTFASDVSVELINQVVDGRYAGVTTGTASARVYDTTYAAHVLGRLSPIYQEDWVGDPDNGIVGYRDKGYSMDALVGESGVEKAFEEYLHGENGTKLITTTSDGQITGEFYTKEPKPGNTVALTLDIDLQEDVEKALSKTIGDMTEKDGIRRGGAAVVVGVGSGEVLALASYPTYDISKWDEIYDTLASDDKGAPLFNRAIGGTYAPGSTFKPCTAVAALESGVITPLPPFWTGASTTTTPPPAPVLDLQLLRLHPRAGGRVGGHHRVLQLLLL